MLLLADGTAGQEATGQWCGGVHVGWPCADPKVYGPCYTSFQVHLPLSSTSDSSKNKTS